MTNNKLSAQQGGRTAQIIVPRTRNKMRYVPGCHTPYSAFHIPYSG